MTKDIDYVLSHGEQALMVLADQVHMLSGEDGAPKELAGVAYILECLAGQFRAAWEGVQS